MQPFVACKKSMNKLWAEGSRMSTAIFLLLFLALASMAGTLLEQDLELAQYQMIYGYFWADVFHKAGVLKVFSSVWFLLVLLFLVLSVTACLLRNGKGIAKQLLRPKTAPGQSVLQRLPIRGEFLETEINKTLNALKQSNWKIRYSSENTYCFEQGRVNRYGYFLLHIGVVLLCIGGVLSGVFGFRGIMNLREGELDNQVRIFGLEEVEIVDLPFYIQNKGFDIAFYDSGMPKNFSSQLAFFEKKSDKNPALQGLLEVNKPLRFMGYTIYQASYGDAGSPVEVLARVLTPSGLAKGVAVAGAVYQTADINQNGTESGYTLEFDDFRAYNVAQRLVAGQTLPQFENEGPSVDYIVRGPDIQPQLVRSYLNMPQFIGLRNGDGSFTQVFLGLSLAEDFGWSMVAAYLQQAALSKPQNKQERIELFQTLDQSALRQLPLDQRLDMALMVMQAAFVLEQANLPVLAQLQNFEQRQYTSLQVAYDPGLWLVALASAMLMLGICAMLFMPHRRLWIWRDADNLWQWGLKSNKKEDEGVLVAKLSFLLNPCHTPNQNG